MAGIPLVHGAWHGPWCWERVAERLRRRGRVPARRGTGRPRRRAGRPAGAAAARAGAGGAVAAARTTRERAVDVAESAGREDLLIGAFTAWTEPTPWVSRPYGMVDERGLGPDAAAGPRRPGPHGPLPAALRAGGGVGRRGRPACRAGRRPGGQAGPGDRPDRQRAGSDRLSLVRRAPRRDRGRGPERPPGAAGPCRAGPGPGPGLPDARAARRRALLTGDARPRRRALRGRRAALRRGLRPARATRVDARRRRRHPGHGHHRGEPAPDGRVRAGRPGSWRRASARWRSTPARWRWPRRGGWTRRGPPWMARRRHVRTCTSRCSRPSGRWRWWRSASRNRPRSCTPHCSPSAPSWPARPAPRW
jgi:hypothetical protein